MPRQMAVRDVETPISEALQRIRMRSGLAAVVVLLWSDSCNIVHNTAWQMAMRGNARHCSDAQDGSPGGRPFLGDRTPSDESGLRRKTGRVISISDLRSKVAGRRERAMNAR